MGDVVDVRNVSVRRNGKEILTDIEWSVEEGERWVVLGPNGAGKTTLIQLISGRMHPTSGEVSIIGEKLGEVDLSQLRALVGLASSALESKIPAGERVLDVVRTAAYGKTASWNEEYDPQDDVRALVLLESVGVGDLAQRVYSTLSSGERKRVGVARALMPNPEVLVLDEPASGLDLGGRERLLGSLQELAEGIYSPVLILVTHHVEEIPAGFTHALLLKDGQVFASGRLEEVLTSHNLSALFDTPVDVSYDDGRFTARAR
ncbi:MAG: ABC transporter ATP-binding protein [Actinomycetaceae bacterium]|nr:ABC transporter ATP-binding protein [Arcanobacterium sp.]MDD7504422.1 ABC transporter ATP-binding protein [Actinomycetaceae bacterium]